MSIPQNILKKLSTLSQWRSENTIIRDYDEYLLSPSGKRERNSGKTALLSYLVPPLLPSQDKRDTTTFSNAGIAQYIPRALNELGYRVDIVNYNNKKFVPDKKYDLFIGHGGINFETISKKLDPSCIQIYFSTGIYWKEWNRVEKERFDALKKRRGIVLQADRIIESDEEYANFRADGIICLGNEHAKETYNQFPHVLKVNNAVFPDSYSTLNKDFESGRKNFLFFNGGGNVHKGLDLVLEVFSGLDLNLYVRQDIEPAFFKAYQKELTKCPNIHLVPYLKKPSTEFYALMDRCNFIISPTCAEGQPGSVIECMAHGLIPILSKEANIDTKDFGITLTENTIAEIRSIVLEISQKPVDWYKNKSSLTIKEIEDYYSPNQFQGNMKSAIIKIIQTKK